MSRNSEVLLLQIFQKKCTGCEKCVEKCPRKVLGVTYTQDGSYATIEYRDRCVGCARCFWVCPSDAIELITA